MSPKYNLTSLSLLVASISVCSAQNIPTETNSLRTTVATQVDGKPALFLSELAGGVACYTTDGQLLWKQATSDPAVLFEIEAADINGDGSDELLAASADGNIYCWSNGGTLLWSFNPGHNVRFSEVAVVNEGKDAQIFAGGNDQTLYEINATGKLVSKTPIKGVVRKIEAGDFLTDGKDTLFLMTYSHDKFRWEFMGILDSETKEAQQTLDLKKSPSKILSKMMLTDFSIADLDQDGLDDILFFGEDMKAVFIGLNGQFERIAEFIGDQKHKQRYAHTIGTSLLPLRNEVVIQYGGLIYVCDSKGKELQVSGERYAGLIYNDLTLEPSSETLYAAGQIGGGNTLYRFDLKQDKWWQTKHNLAGRLLEVENNLAKLYQQVIEFTPPAYQKRSDKNWVMIIDHTLPDELAALDGAELLFVDQIGMQEDSDRAELVAAIGDIALRRDKRMKYDKTQEEIVQIARDHERNGTPFTAWAGHGNDPFITPIDTMEAVLEAAPNTCYGFIYAEMHNVEDPRVHHFIKEYVPRLAKAIRKHGKAKLYFRYKNMFWGASAYQEPWNSLFFSGEYSDILVPAAEDTSSRTQDVNFTGRVGMFAGGYVGDFAMRLVDDNPTSWRPLSPGGQRSVSPYLRNGVIMAAYGARYGIIFDNKYLEAPGMNILYALMKSGAIPIVDKEAIESIGSWHLIHDVDTELLHIVDDHHNLNQYTTTDEEAVFSVTGMHWAGTNLPAHDYSKIALGLNYRWLNYMPEMPNGMVPIAPTEAASKLNLLEKQIPYSISNLKSGYVNGKPVDAKTFGPLLKKVTELGGERLPIRVTGASWSAIRLDASHVRLVLVDPGYADPQVREATVHFQGNTPVSAKDILSKEPLNIKNQKIELTVPSGSLRLIDLTY